MAKQPRKIDPHGETPSSWTLYRLKWANGEISLIALVPGQELADVIDQVTDPGDAAIEVTRFKGPLWITFDAKGEPYREDCDHDEEMAAALELADLDDDEEGDGEPPEVSADQLAQAARETTGPSVARQPGRQAGPTDRPTVVDELSAARARKMSRELGLDVGPKKPRR